MPCASNEEAIGGSAANVATGLTKFGIPTTLLAAVGDDLVGRSEHFDNAYLFETDGLEALKKRGVNTAGVVVIPNGRTDQSTVVRSGNCADSTHLAITNFYSYFLL